MSRKLRSQQLRQYRCLSYKKKRTYLFGISRVFRPLFSVSLISLYFLSVFLSLFCFALIFCQFFLWAISLHCNIIIHLPLNQELNSKDLRANGFSDGSWLHVIFEGFCGLIHAIFQETSTTKNCRSWVAKMLAHTSSFNGSNSQRTSLKGCFAIIFNTFSVFVQNDNMSSRHGENVIIFSFRGPRVLVPDPNK